MVGFQNLEDRLAIVPEPIDWRNRTTGSFRMLGTLLEANPYLGRIITGRIFSGTIKTNAPVKVLDRLGHSIETGRVSKILAFRGIEHSPIEKPRQATSSPSPAWKSSTSPTPCAARKRSSRFSPSRSTPPPCR